MRYIYLVVAYIFVSESIFAAPCVDMTPAMAKMQQQKITIINDNGRDIQLNILVADNDVERATGFQHICPHIIKKRPLLFVYQHEQYGRFHMQNVHAPLDIAFFDSAGKLIDMQQMQPYTTDDKPLYGPDEIAFQFALETSEGFFASHLISSANSYLKF